VLLCDRAHPKRKAQHAALRASAMQNHRKLTTREGLRIQTSTSTNNKKGRRRLKRRQHHHNKLVDRSEYLPRTKRPPLRGTTSNIALCFVSSSSNKIKRTALGLLEGRPNNKALRSFGWKESEALTRCAWMAGRTIEHRFTVPSTSKYRFTALCLPHGQPSSTAPCMAGPKNSQAPLHCAPLAVRTAKRHFTAFRWLRAQRSTGSARLACAAPG